MMNLQDKMNDLTPEQREEARTLKTSEEALEFAKREGYELSIDELDVVSGGWGPADCPNKVSNS